MESRIMKNTEFGKNKMDFTGPLKSKFLLNLKTKQKTKQKLHRFHDCNKLDMLFVTLLIFLLIIKTELGKNLIGKKSFTVEHGGNKSVLIYTCYII